MVALLKCFYFDIELITGIGIFLEVTDIFGIGILEEELE